MTQDHSFSFDNNVYPLGTGTGNTILADGDIVNQKILQFYRGILHANLGARWAEECSKSGLTNSSLQNLHDGYIVGDAICYPLPATLKQTDYKFPILSAYRENEVYKQFSTSHIMTESHFVITWTLPPLANPMQSNHIYPFLSLVSKTILFYTFVGNDPKYNNGELVWSEAGFAFATMEGAKFGSFLGNDDKTVFPSVQIRLVVYERNNAVPSDYEALTGFDNQIDNLDGYHVNNPYNAIVQSDVELGLAITSFTPSSGSIAGNTLVTIHGNGFQGANLVEPYQLQFAGQSCSRYKVMNDNVILAITAYTTTITTGRIAITDQVGNIATSTTNYSYT